ncbi:hypothetical protein [Fimbriimonas ginsengisoli]|nr:hypothetical protein [Fimbriimonas ginsengisoli]
MKPLVAEQAGYYLAEPTVYHLALSEDEMEQLLNCIGYAVRCIRKEELQTPMADTVLGRSLSEELVQIRDSIQAVVAKVNEAALQSNEVVML